MNSIVDGSSILIQLALQNISRRSYGGIGWVLPILVANRSFWQMLKNNCIEDRHERHMSHCTTRQPGALLLRVWPLGAIAQYKPQHLGTCSHGRTIDLPA